MDEDAIDRQKGLARMSQQEDIDAVSPELIGEGGAPAPTWHFLTFIAFLLSIACFGLVQKRFGSIAHLHVPAATLFGAVILLDLLLSVYAYWGFCLTGSGGRLISSTPGSWKRRAVDILIGTALGIGLIAAGVAIGTLLPGGQGNLAPRLAKTNFDHLMEFLAYGVASVCEEIQFRGYFLQQFLALTRNPGWAVVFQAVFFVFMHGAHQSLAGYLSRFLFGVAFGIVALSRKSLWPSMTAHFLIDVTAFAVGLS